ncbi:MAG: MauE/DoxX family redox-associated membrane protein [Nitrospinota bacterium]
MNGPSKRSEVLGLVLRAVLGGVFVLSAVSKAVSPESFEAILRQHQVLPAGWLRPFAYTLPWVELVSGTFLLLGLFYRVALAAAGIQLVVFLGALLLAVGRGIDLSDCGCFAGFGWRETPAQAVVRDLVLLAMAAWLWRKRTGRFTLDRWLGGD